MSDAPATATSRPARVASRLTLAGALAALPAPALAQIVTDDHLSTVDALQHDAANIMALAGRQIAMPFTGPFGLPILLAGIGLAILVAWPVRLWLLARLSGWIAAAPLDRRLAVSARALTTVIVTTCLVALAGKIVLQALALSVTLLPESQVLAEACAMALGIAGLGMGVGRALSAPDDSAWRPVALPPGLGRTIGWFPRGGGIMLGVTSVIDQAARLLHLTDTSWTIAQGVIVLVETALIARFLILAGEARERQVEAAASTEKGPAVPAVFGLTAVVWAALAVGVLAFLFGHTRIAMLILQELLWMALVLTIAWLLTRFFDAAFAQLFDADRTVGRFATAVVGVQRARVKQVALIGSAVLTVFVWVIALGLVAAPLHGGHAVVIEQLRPSPLLGSVKSLNLSPRTVGAAAAVLLIGIALTRMMRGWLENRFLPETSLDNGIRTSLVTGLTYVGVIVALLSATSMLGLQLEKVTLIASALSVGIGFGLQSIIQNFVSGVILLIERPVQPGDWVSVSGAEGTIRRIRVRATELATADGGTAIVPNSSFISSNVSNREDAHMAARLDLTLTVSGCPSAEDARAAVLDLCMGCTKTLREQPAPRLLLTTLGADEWVFSLRVYAQPGTGVGKARSDLLFWLAAHAEGKGVKIKSG